MKNKKTFIITGIIFLIFIAQWTLHARQVNDVITAAKIEINKKSDEEILFSKAKEYSEISDRTLTSIEELKTKITELENTYENNILKKRCYQDQLKRKSEKQEVVEGFCENDENLEEYRSSKKKANFQL